jgi:DnaJ-domain-containing protein 1
VSEVAEKAGVDEEFAIASLLEQGLVYREWLGAARQEWYEILGVEPDCSVEELRQARKELAKQYHPDTGAASELMLTSSPPLNDGDS